MASMSLSSGISQPSIELRRRHATSHRRILAQISPARRDSHSKLRSILTPVKNKSAAIFSENLDDWIRESAPEIVRNLRRSPLLVHVVDGGEGIRTERAVAEDWEKVARRWREGESPAPDGLMLVEELAGDDDVEERETRAWGIVVQGKKCGAPACYLLKTCRVGSGLGFACTHFCLTRVRDFRESALSQLTNCWLLN